MAEFECPVVEISRVEDHPGADRLSLVYFNEYITISAKLDDGSHRYKVGDLVVYVPESAIVPDYLLMRGYWDEEKNKGILAGPDGNIVKAIKLRKILSQGIMFPVINEDPTYRVAVGMFGSSILLRNRDETGPIVGTDVAGPLGITKYEAPIPSSMAGDVVSLGRELIVQFDVENIKKLDRILEEGENVVITEKLHGTMMGIGYFPGLKEDDRFKSDFFCFSKGLGKQGLVFPLSTDNLYTRVLKANIDLLEQNIERYTPTFIFGEVYGTGVQDLQYGTKAPEFRIFDMYFGNRGKGAWAYWTTIEAWGEALRIPTVPVLYKGPYHPNNRTLKDGKSTLANHVREGIVIKPQVPREHPRYGRVILKDVSDAYLTRKGGTEYN